MKLIIDINPYLERNFAIEKFESQKEIMAMDNKVTLNKSSVECLKIFDIFGVNSLLITILGGNNGELYEKLLKNEAIDYVKVPIRDEIQERIYISSDQRALDIRTEEPRVTMDEVNDLYSLFSNHLTQVNFVLIPESSDTERSIEFLENLINISYKAGVKIGVVANKYNVKSIISKKPYAIILNTSELEEYSNQELNFEWEITKICNGILDSGVGIVLLARSNKELHLYNGEELLIATISNPTGEEINKNKAISGYIAGISKGYDNSMSLSIALAAAKPEVAEIEKKLDAANIKLLLKEIKVDKFNA